MHRKHREKKLISLGFAVRTRPGGGVKMGFRRATKTRERARETSERGRRRRRDATPKGIRVHRARRIARKESRHRFAAVAAAAAAIFSPRQ